MNTPTPEQQAEEMANEWNSIWWRNGCHSNDKMGVKESILSDGKLADVFEGDEEMPATDVPRVRAAQRRLFKLIYDTPNLDWLLLTKRPENVMKHLLQIIYTVEDDKCDSDERFYQWLRDWRDAGQPPENVWLGISVENQKAANQRIPGECARKRDMTTPKPCPFCGIQGAIWKLKEDDDENAEYLIACAVCKARGPSTSMEEMAMFEWNRRRL